MLRVLPIFWVLLLAAAPASEDVETALDSIVRRLDTELAAERQAAQEDLDRLVEACGDRALDALRRRAEKASPEARGRIESALAFRARLEAARKELAVFDLLGLPDCRDMTFVLYNTGASFKMRDPEGGHLLFECRHGWLLSHDAERITLFGENLTIKTYDRRTEHPHVWDRIKEQQPKGNPRPGEIRPICFESFCMRFFGDKTKESADDIQHVLLLGGLSAELEPALYAYWALQRDQAKLATNLLDLAHRKTARLYQDDPLSFTNRLRRELADNRKWQAADAANHGESRRQLLDRWKTIVKIAPEDAAQEPRNTVAAYEKMLREDDAWVEPRPEDLERMDPAARVAYWMHKLRDLAVRQFATPGYCYVLESEFVRSRRRGGPNPANELVCLGWDALPAVIAHFDDPRPTRCLSSFDHSRGNAGELLSYGDCCRQIFGAITGRVIYETPTGTRDLVQVRAGKAAAEAWWAETGKAGAAAYYMKCLRSDEKAVFALGDMTDFAVEKLMALNQDKHLPRLLEIMEKGSTYRKRVLFLAVLPYLGREHQALLEGFLQDEPPRVALAVAARLWEACGAESGPREILDRLKKGERAFVTEHVKAFPFLAHIRKEFVAEGLRDLMRSRHSDIRVGAMKAAAHFRSATMAESLAAHLEDKTLSGCPSKIRFCDVAAEAFVEMMDLSHVYTLKDELEDRDRTIRDLQAWWAANKGAIDWAELQRKAEEGKK